MTGLVIVGRDGVLNQIVEGGLLRPEQWRSIPGSLEAIGRLNHAGYRVVLASNRPELDDGRLDMDGLNALHAHLQQLLMRVGGHLDGLFICPHAPDAGCDCRKPATGLLRAASERLSLPLRQAWMIGDDPEDIQAARAAGAHAILVRTGRGADTEARLKSDPSLVVTDDLAHAVEHLLV